MSLSARLQRWTLAAFVVVAGAPAAFGHGGTYTAPGPGGATPGGAFPRPPAGGHTPGNNPRGGGTTPLSETGHWEVWWKNNREDFLPARGVDPAASTGDSSNTALRALTPAEVRDQVVPALLEALKDRDHELRNSAAVALGKVGDARELGVLIETLADRERDVSEAAIVGLGLLRLPKAEEQLVKIMEDSTAKPRSRALAALALGLSGGEVARKPLFDRLGVDAEPGAGTRTHAGSIEALRVLGAALWAGADRRGGTDDRAAMAATLLVRALKDPGVKDVAFGQTGTAALAKTRDPSALRHVLVTLSDRKALTRASAAIAAGRVFRATDVAAVATLIGIAGSEPDPFARRMMSIALGRIGSTAARQALVLGTQASDRQDRAFAWLALGIAGATEEAPRLRKEFEAANDEVLKGAMGITLGLMKDQAAAPLIQEALKSRGSPDLQGHLVWYFALANVKSGATELARILAEARTAEVQSASALVLGLIGAVDAQPLMLKLLSGTSPQTVKAAVATGLGRMGDRRALEPLLALARNTHEQELARAFSVVALGILASRVPAPELARVSIDLNYEVHTDVVDELVDLL